MTALFIDTYPYVPSNYIQGFGGDEDDVTRLVSGDLWERVAEGKKR